MSGESGHKGPGILYRSGAFIETGWALVAIDGTAKFESRRRCARFTKGVRALIPRPSSFWNIEPRSACFLAFTEKLVALRRIWIHVPKSVRANQIPISERKSR